MGHLAKSQTHRDLDVIRRTNWRHEKVQDPAGLCANIAFNTLLAHDIKPSRAALFIVLASHSLYSRPVHHKAVFPGTPLSRSSSRQRPQEARLLHTDTSNLTTIDMAPRRGGSSGSSSGSSISSCPGAFSDTVTQVLFASDVLFLVVFFGITITLCSFRKKSGGGKKLLGVPYILALLFFLM